MESNIIAKDERLVEESYERVKAELDALTPEQLVTVNLEVTAAVATILGALPEIKRLRERMVKELPAFDIARFDKLQDYAEALVFAQGKYQFANQPVGALEQLAAESVKLREKLVVNAQALALAGLFEASNLEHLKGANGYKNIAQDLQALSTALREAWPTIQGKSTLVEEDVRAASRAALQLTRIVGLREQGPVLLAAASELRTRAFTVVLETYEEARLAVAYLRRREDDADSIAPSLYPGKARRRTVEAPAAPAPAGSAAPAPSSATAASTSSTASGTAPAAIPSTSNNGPFMS